MSLTSSQIRDAFVAYFQEHGHLFVPSSPLIPQNDPTLLFTNAGMVPFKRVFTGEEERPAPCAVSSQKCVRAGGKHNDLENVGYTGRHHTFFEMLGNFSFGDYFKSEAIRFGWQFLTENLALPKERLWVSVYKDDDEAYALWRDQEGVPEARIMRLGEKDNFWQMGDTGPCGPCTEIHIDQGEAVGCGKPTCAVGCDEDTCDRFLEIWNLVFMQYNRDESGTLHPLPKPSIDTGMGLERLTAVVNGVTNNYDTDLFLPIIRSAADTAGVTYGKDKKTDTALKVLADHCRSISFLIADGVLPANDGRGYVLRRVLRRAARYGLAIGLQAGAVADLCQVVVEHMGGTYAELIEAKETIATIVRGEEIRFSNTLGAGVERLAEALDKAEKKGLSDLPGEDLFNLYDTYGFPSDLAGDIARERGMGVDLPGFDRAMQAQKERARASWKGAADAKAASIYGELASKVGDTPFVGYTTTHHATTVAALLKGGAPVDTAAEGDPVEVILAETPFYAESGGQAGDSGLIEVRGASGSVDTVIEVSDTKRPGGAMVVHTARVVHGTIATGDRVEAKVHVEKRHDTARNHTATHLLHAVLRDTLGAHVKQAGSLVAPEKLRFDFTHFQPLTRTDIAFIEQQVNRHIRAASPVDTQVKDLESAIASGAMALFGEKYGNEVRVVRISDVSTELCGGTHCGGVGEIGLFKITSEGSVAAGVRRIEAVTGVHAEDYVRGQEERLLSAAHALKATPDTVTERAVQLVAQIRERDRQIERLQMQMAEGGGGNEEKREIGGHTVLTRRDDGLDVAAMRTLSDKVRDQIGSGAAMLASVTDGRVSLLCIVSKDLNDRLKAGDLMREVAQMVGGKGGGRPDMAQGGGTDPAALDGALAAFFERVTERLNG
ncbi:MAG: alanine--tRNA ligase [Nitrospirota bacterium]|nr:alanine--tRNA ligase [Nitrospirota bacterium]